MNKVFATISVIFIWFATNIAYTTYLSERVTSVLIYGVFSGLMAILLVWIFSEGKKQEKVVVAPPPIVDMPIIEPRQPEKKLELAEPEVKEEELKVEEEEEPKPEEVDINLEEMEVELEEKPKKVSKKKIKEDYKKKLSEMNKGMKELKKLKEQIGE